MGSIAADEPIPPQDATSTTAEADVDSELPKLLPADFKAYNKLAVMMQYYHNHFRQTWTTLYTAASTNQRPPSLSLPAFLNLGLQFISHLTVHHTIEEQHIFPVLATRMPEFREGADMISQHAVIHDGLERLEEYLVAVRRGERELVLGDDGLKGVMDGFGETLWRHLDDEVGNLGAANMRRYWTKEEIRGMNW